MQDDSELLKTLRDVSVVLGSDPLLVQGPGGNTSCKVDGEEGPLLWIKASGTWLSQAAARDIFVPVHLEAILAAVDAAQEKLPAHAVAGGGPDGLRPSIETTLHALMPHRFVLHSHAVNTIATASRSDAQGVLEDKLGGLRFTFVPYCRPGLPLTLALLERLAQADDVDVVVLGNHGLVVGADSAEAALELTREVEARLAMAPRAARRECHASALGSWLGSGDWRLPDARVSHAVAFDAQALGVARGGSLYPDHVIFLGPALAVAAAPEEAPVESAAVAVPGAGVVLRDSAPPAADWMVHALSEVTTRLGSEAPVQYLSTTDEDALMNWDAEKYRRSLAQS